MKKSIKDYPACNELSCVFSVCYVMALFTHLKLVIAKEKYKNPFPLLGKVNSQSFGHAVSECGLCAY